MNKIELIKEVRALIPNIGLKDAKDIVETYPDFQNGELPDINRFIEMEKEYHIKNPPIPRTQQERIYIRRRVAGIKELLDSIEWEDDFGEDGLSEIQEVMEKIIDDAFMIKDRLVRDLSDSLAEEERKEGE